MMAFSSFAASEIELSPQAKKQGMSGICRDGPYPLRAECRPKCFRELRIIVKLIASLIAKVKDRMKLGNQIFADRIMKKADAETVLGPAGYGARATDAQQV